MSENVNSIFSAIARKYDVINSILTLNIDKGWRKKSVELCKIKEGYRILDLCCGTGEMCLEIVKTHARGIAIKGMDFNEEMLQVALRKFHKSSSGSHIELIQGDITELPFDDNKFDVITIAFGLRNIADKKKALFEMHRVLKPGGRLICLELSQPDMRLFRSVYSLYFNQILPFLGYLISGDKAAYRYLRDSVNSFLSKSKLKDLFDESKFENTDYRSLTGGIAAIHFGEKYQAAF